MLTHAYPQAISKQSLHFTSQVGAIYYSAPELKLGEVHYDGKVDVFSLG